MIEDLIKGLGQKNPKVVAGCLITMREILRCFGAKIIKVSPLLKAAIPLLDNRDKTVRIFETNHKRWVFIRVLFRSVKRANS